MNAGPVTVLVSELAGWNQLVRVAGDDEAQRLRRIHFALVRDTAAAFGAPEIKAVCGSLAAVFEHPGQAAGCALAILRANAGGVGGSAGGGADGPVAGGSGGADGPVGGGAGNVAGDDASRKAGPRTPLPIRIGLCMGGEDVGVEAHKVTVAAQCMCHRAQAGEIIANGPIAHHLPIDRPYQLTDAGALTIEGAARPIATIQVQPDGEQSTASEAFEHLSSRCREVLRTASVIDEPFDLQLLAQASELDGSTLHQVLDEAFRFGVLEAGTVPQTYQFVDPRLRRHLYDGLSLPRRRLLHLRLSRSG